jgi:hypothetical protein
MQRQRRDLLFPLAMFGGAHPGTLASRAVIFCGFIPPERRAEEFFQANLAFKAQIAGVL